MRVQFIDGPYEDRVMEIQDEHKTVELHHAEDHAHIETLRYHIHRVAQQVYSEVGGFRETAFIGSLEAAPPTKIPSIKWSAVEGVFPDFLTDFDRWLNNCIARHAPWTWQAKMRTTQIEMLGERR